jgi:hypothetical protein
MPNQHLQEPTAFSLTDTVVDGRHALSPSTSSGNAIRSSTSTDSLKDEKLKPAHFASVDPRLTPSTIPPPDSNRTYRTLVVCFDGTGDQFDADNSNIVKLVSLLKKDDKTKQMVYYQVSVAPAYNSMSRPYFSFPHFKSGIGTYTSPKVATPLMAKFTMVCRIPHSGDIGVIFIIQILDLMFAWNLNAHVMSEHIHLEVFPC